MNEAFAELAGNQKKYVGSVHICYWMAPSLYTRIQVYDLQGSVYNLKITSLMNDFKLIILMILSLLVDPSLGFLGTSSKKYQTMNYFTFSIVIGPWLMCTS